MLTLATPVSVPRPSSEMPRLSVPLESFSWGLRAHPTNDPGSWLAHTEGRWCWVTALPFSLGRLGQLSRADFSIILAAHLKLSVLAHRLGGHSTGGRDDGFWNLPWNWSISGEIALWASSFPAIEPPEDISLCLPVFHPVAAWKGFFHLLLYIHLKWLLQYLIFIRTWKPGIYFAGQLLIHFPRGLWQEAGEPDTSSGGAAINVSPGDRGTNQSAAGYPGKDKSGSKG